MAATQKLTSELENIVKDEVNVKEIRYRGINAESKYQLTLNFPVLGKKVGEKIKAIKSDVAQGKYTHDANGVTVAGIKLEYGDYSLKILPVEEKATAHFENGYAYVFLDTAITPKLEAEGIARDMVRAIQQARKDGGLNVSDRINLHVDAPEAISKALAAHKKYVMEQTLSVDILDAKPADSSFSAESTIDDQKVIISIARAA